MHVDGLAPVVKYRRGIHYIRKIVDENLGVLLHDFSGRLIEL